MKPYEIEDVSSEPSLHEFSLDDYLDASALWRDISGVGLDLYFLAVNTPAGKV